jgi:hypothetical protein
LLARIHALDVRAPETLDDTLAVLGDEGWAALLARADAAHASWPDELRAALPVIARLEAIVLAARARGDTQLMSHRDADAKNLLLTGDGRIMLVDWDAAAPVSPRMEAVGHAFTWAGAHYDLWERIDQTIARAFMEAYQRSTGTRITVERDDFGEILHGMLRWYAFNVRRALGDRLNDPSDRDLGEQLARSGFIALQRYERAMEDLTSAVNSPLSS